MEGGKPVRSACDALPGEAVDGVRQSVTAFPRHRPVRPAHRDTRARSARRRRGPRREVPGRETRFSPRPRREGRRRDSRGRCEVSPPGVPCHDERPPGHSHRGLRARYSCSGPGGAACAPLARPPASPAPRRASTRRVATARAGCRPDGALIDAQAVGRQAGARIIRPAELGGIGTAGDRTQRCGGAPARRRRSVCRPLDRAPVRTWLAAADGVGRRLQGPAGRRGGAAPHTHPCAVRRGDQPQFTAEYADARLAVRR